MSQQVLPQYAPMVKAFDENNQEVYIPAAIASGQTRDGKDELIVGAGNMVFDPTIGDNGMWVPVSEANPLETRVRHLETLIGAIAESPAANTVQARLKTLADRLGEAVEEPDENTLLARIAQLETELTNIKNTLTDGTQKTTLTGQEGALPVTIEGVGDPGGALPVKEAIMQAFVVRKVEALTPTRLDIDPLANRRYVDLSLVEDNATGYVGNSDLTGPENGIPVTKDDGWRLYSGSDMPIYGVGGTFVIVEVA